MKSRPHFLRIAAALIGFTATIGQSFAQLMVDESPYAWELPVVTGIRDAAPLIDVVRAETDRILEAGPLAPLYVNTADQESVGYMLYQEPGRIVTTLAWAYPHLDGPRQTAVRAYVNAIFADPQHSPWGITAYGKNGNTNYPLPIDAGAAREDHPKDRWWYANPAFGNNRPFLHTLYGVWLYGWRSGDWTAIETAWPAIRTRYNQYANAAETRLYGGMGTHVAIARLAHQFNDAATRDSALTNLRNALLAGLDFDAVESLARGTPGFEWQSPYGSFPDMFDSRMDGTSYRGWVFLNLAPEIARYLREESPVLAARVAERHAFGKQRFPLWWLPKVSYFTRSWTGDEGTGLLPEVMGMIAPLERWFAQTDAHTLARQMRGSPWGRGDCHWIEALVQAIEAHGTTTWRDLRHPHVPFALWQQQTFGDDHALPRAQPFASWHASGMANIVAYALGFDPLSRTPPPIAHGISVSGNSLQISFSMAKSAWDVIPLVEVSDDLIHWQSGPVFTRELSRIDQGDAHWITVADRIPVAPGQSRFIRLSVQFASPD